MDTACPGKTKTKLFKIFLQCVSWETSTERNVSIYLVRPFLCCQGVISPPGNQQILRRVTLQSLTWPKIDELGSCCLKSNGIYFQIMAKVGFIVSRVSFKIFTGTFMGKGRQYILAKLPHTRILY